MRLLGLAGAAAFSLTSLVVGVRLLLLARRTLALPEFLMGFAFAVGGALGNALLVLSRAPEALPEELRLPVFVFGRLCTTASALALLAAAWRIFRKEETWAALLMGACVLVLVGYVARDVLVHGPDDPVGGVWWWAGMAVTAAAYGWTCGESLRYHALLRRRSALGLGEPEIANRMLLWGLGSGSIAALVAISVGVRAFAGGELALLQLVTSGLGLFCAGCIWLAFFPPRAYRARVAARAG